MSHNIEDTLNKGTFCNLQISIWTASRKVPTGTVTIGEGADESLFRVNKDLIEKSVLRPIRQQAQCANEYLHNRALPFNIRGIYYLPNSSIHDALEKIKSFEETFNYKVEEFCTQYVQYRDEARIRLNGHFREQEYPSVRDIRDKFGWNLQIMQFSAPSQLQLVSSEMYREAKLKFDQEIEEFRFNSMALLRSRFSELVEHVCDRLTPDADGNRKIFRNSTVDNLKEFIEGFSHLNITDDSSLAEEVNKVSMLIDGMDPEMLRSNEVMIQRVSSVMIRVKETVSGLVENAPKRKIRYQKREEVA